MTRVSGGARVSRAGGGVPPPRTFAPGTTYPKPRLPHLELPWAVGKTGPVWEKERFDRYIRSDRDLEEKFHYVLRNPWDAGLVGPDEEYPWIWMPEDELRSSSESSSPQDASTSTRDACATPTESRVSHLASR